MTDQPSPYDNETAFLHRVVWVLNRTKVTPAPEEWAGPGCLFVDRSAAYPEDTNYPTGVTLIPLPGEDRWWGPDSDFVNEDAEDGGFSLASALTVLASVTVALLAYDCARDPDHKERADAQAWWEHMATDRWGPGTDADDSDAVRGTDHGDVGDVAALFDLPGPDPEDEEPGTVEVLP